MDIAAALKTDFLHCWDRHFAFEAYCRRDVELVELQDLWFDIFDWVCAQSRSN